MAHPMGEREAGVLRLGFDRRLKLEFHGSKVSSDAGLLPYRELDDAVGLTEIAGDALTDTRRGKNGRHGLVGQFRQSVFGRLGGYDDVNDADRLSLDPVMRWIVGGHSSRLPFRSALRRRADANQFVNVGLYSWIDPATGSESPPVYSSVLIASEIHCPRESPGAPSRQEMKPPRAIAVLPAMKRGV